MWSIFAAMIYMQFLNVSAPIEALLFVLAIMAFTFPVTTYLSKVLLRRAIKKENITSFTVQFITCTLILAFFLCAAYQRICIAEKKGVFPVSTMFMVVKGLFILNFWEIYFLLLFPTWPSALFDF